MSQGFTPVKSAEFVWRRSPETGNVSLSFWDGADGRRTTGIVGTPAEIAQYARDLIELMEED